MCIPVLAERTGYYAWLNKREPRAEREAYLKKVQRYLEGVAYPAKTTKKIELFGIGNVHAAILAFPSTKSLL